MAQLRFGQIFVKKKKIIAEIKVGLLRITLVERSTAHMINTGLRQCVNFSATCKQAPTEVYFLHVSKEEFVEPAGTPVGTAAHHHCSACCPKDWGYTVILSIVNLYGVKYTSAAIRVTVTVNIASRRTGILKAGLVLIIEYLWLASNGFRVGFHEFKYGGKPAWRNLHIGIQKYIIFCIDLLKRLVIATGKTVVLVKEQQPHRGKHIADYLYRVVGRCVVGNNYFSLRSIFHHFGQEVAQHLRTVIIEYYYCSLFHISDS